MSDITKSASTALESLSSKKTPLSLDTLTQELIDMIIELLLTDAPQHAFETYGTTQKYSYSRNLSLMLVNKHLSTATLQAIVRVNEFVIISSNYEPLRADMTLHRVPIVTDRAIQKVKGHAVEIDIHHPKGRQGFQHSFLMKKSGFDRLAKLLRYLNIGLPHRIDEWGELIPEVRGDKVSELDYMTMRVEFQKPAGKDLSTTDRSSWLSSLKAANSICNIKILGESDDTLLSMLPGREEAFRPLGTSNYEDSTLYQARAVLHFEKNREEDARNINKMLANQIFWIDLAYSYGDADLMRRRCSIVARILSSPLFLHLSQAVQDGSKRFVIHQTLLNIIQIRWAYCDILLGNWIDAFGHLSPLLNDLKAGTLYNGLYKGEEPKILFRLEQKIWDKDNKRDPDIKLLPVHLMDENMALDYLVAPVTPPPPPPANVMDREEYAQLDAFGLDAEMFVEDDDDDDDMLCGESGDAGQEEGEDEEMEDVE